jgi:hypothetical protein
LFGTILLIQEDFDVGTNIMMAARTVNFRVVLLVQLKRFSSRLGILKGVLSLEDFTFRVYSIHFELWEYLSH